MDYFINIIVLINIYIILALSFNLLLGYGGLFSLAHAISYGLGGYISALFAIKMGLPPILTIIISIVSVALFSLILAFPALRISGDYLVIASLGFQIFLVQVLLNLDITGGPAGLPGIPRMSIFGYQFTSATSFSIFTFILVLLVVAFKKWLVRLPFGRVLEAIREDEEATRSLGKNTAKYKLVIFMIASGIAGLAGGLYAHYFQYLNPYDFQMPESVLILSMVIIGGSGTIWGPIIGAILLVALPEALRFISLPTSVAAPLRQIMYTILVLLFLYFKPQGIIKAKPIIRKYKSAKPQKIIEEKRQAV